MNIEDIKIGQRFRVLNSKDTNIYERVEPMSYVEAYNAYDYEIPVWVLM